MYSPFKMKGRSPMMKALIGKQNNLPEQLKAKILASPATMKKESMAPMKKESMAKMKKESSMKMMKKSPAKKKVVNTDADGNKTVSRVNRKGVTRKTKTFKNAPGVTKAGKVEKFRKDGSSKKIVVKGAKTNTVTKTNKKGVSKTKVKNNLKTKVKNTGKALGNAGKAVGKGIKSIPKHLDNLGALAGATAITGKGLMALTNPAVFTTAAMAAGMDMANSTVGAVRNQVKKNKANKKARKKAGIDKKGNPITMKKNSMAKMAKKSPSKMMKKSPSKMMKKK
tara:strand:- start:11 stop:853 length:843 start_codon:yes stop_codon:yes gene_type:complete